MVKGVLVGFGIMIVLALIPIVHFIGIPFGPFIGGYFGISAVGGFSESRAKRALAFGGMLGGLIFLVSALVGVVLMMLPKLFEFLDLNINWNANVLLVWGLVAFFTLYTMSMSALGAMYAQLRSSG